VYFIDVCEKEIGVLSKDLTVDDSSGVENEPGIGKWKWILGGGVVIEDLYSVDDVDPGMGRWKLML
jgi:hypothetical protein